MVFDLAVVARGIDPRASVQRDGVVGGHLSSIGWMDTEIGSMSKRTPEME